MTVQAANNHPLNGHQTATKLFPLLFFLKIPFTILKPAAYFAKMASSTIMHRRTA
jgi:hypothetical protein